MWQSSKRTNLVGRDGTDLRTFLAISELRSERGAVDAEAGRGLQQRVLSRWRLSCFLAGQPKPRRTPSFRMMRKSFFSDLTHYVRSGDFILALLRDGKGLDGCAFAFGALAHYAANNDGHRIGTNRAVPILYPE
jgi:hypothetical protein